MLLRDVGFAPREVHYYGLPRWLRPLSGRPRMRSLFSTMIAVVAAKE
jgi:hypothetical protein